jgi:hypothetical protein
LTYLLSRLPHSVKSNGSANETTGIENTIIAKKKTASLERRQVLFGLLSINWVSAGNVFIGSLFKVKIIALMYIFISLV